MNHVRAGSLGCVTLLIIALDTDVKVLHFLPGPGSSAQECEARLDAWIKFETPDINDASQVLPPEMFYELGEDHFQRFSMKRIFGWHTVDCQFKIQL